MELHRDLIIEEVNKKDKITFAEFMQMALYHTKYGYYNSDKERVGRFGDYYTSPAVHRVFGELIAKQLEEMWRIMGGGQFTVVELGANRGWLCQDILSCIQNTWPEFYRAVRYIIVESNPYAKRKQELLFNSLGFKEKVAWHELTPDGFTFDKIQGCFLSNEFFDALPVHRLRTKKGILKEVYVSYNGNDFWEIEDEVSGCDLKHYAEALPEDLKEVQEYEVCPDSGRWIQFISDALQCGFVITIDYGDSIDNLCYRYSNGGTLRCYYKHTVNRDFYKRIGEQDITAHVDFTNLMNTGRRWGLETTGFVRQSHFLIALGMLDRLDKAHTDTETILKIKNLFHPEGMGDVFKVLIQHKHIKNPQVSGLKALQSIKM